MSLIEFERVGDVAIIALNRPERMNALGSEILSELREAYRELADDASLRVGVITGRGRAFTAGRDIKEGAQTGELARQATTANLDLFMENNSPKPLVSAVNGYAGGAGFYLATRAVDFVVAGASAVFQIAEVPRGIMHGWQTGYWAGLSRAAARELAFGFKISGRRAYDMGLANAYAEDADLMDTALSAARHLAAMPATVIEANRQFLKRLDPVIDENLAAEAKGVYRALLATQGAGDAEFLAAKKG